MTGIGRGEAQGEGFCVVAEVKSVNHRFRDFRFRMPQVFSQKEMLFRSFLGEVFRRGSFEVVFSIKRSEGHGQRVDFSRAQAFIQEFQKYYPNFTLSPTDFLRSEFFVDDSQNEGLLFDLAMQALSQARKNLEGSRRSEGEKLLKIFYHHLEVFESQLDHLSQQAETMNHVVAKRLKGRFCQTELNVPESRLMQEVLFYLEKLDISEEINRMRAHAKRAREVLSTKDEVGREIEFIVQEINREANTLLSKSSMVEISEEAVKMKVELEKMREQGPNIQ